jgi:hypothetical protein
MSDEFSREPQRQFPWSAPMAGTTRFNSTHFSSQLVRVVDSSNNEYCLEVVSPTTNVTSLSRQQFDAQGVPRTALGQMMAYLGVNDLAKLSPMIRTNDDDRPISPSWVQVYRELVEWAILFTVLREKNFGTDTIIVCDGLLRSKVFARELFQNYLRGLEEGIDAQFKETKRRLFLAGVCKSKGARKRCAC